MLKCEICGSTDQETDMGDFGGTVACYACAEKEPELWAYLEEDDDG